MHQLQLLHGDSRRAAEASNRVRYVPHHADGDTSHPDCEDGRISSFNETTVFVRFDKQVGRLGWEGTTSQGCDPENLRLL